MTYKLWFIKLFGIFAVPFFFYDLEILFLVSSLLFLHFNSGLKTILKDYFHNLNLAVLIIMFLRILNLEFLRYTLEAFL